MGIGFLIGLLIGLVLTPALREIMHEADPSLSPASSYSRPVPGMITLVQNATNTTKVNGTVSNYTNNTTGKVTWETLADFLGVATGLFGFQLAFKQLILALQDPTGYYTASVSLGLSIASIALTLDLPKHPSNYQAEFVTGLAGVSLIIDGYSFTKTSGRSGPNLWFNTISAGLDVSSFALNLVVYHDKF